MTPIGNLVRQTGPYAASNPYRFSTKYHDDETGLVYYGYRYYSPNLGRWLSRDPIGERGGTVSPNRGGYSVLEYFIALLSVSPVAKRRD